MENFTNPKMTKEFSISISKSSSLPETATALSSRYTTSDVFKTEICLAIKCVTSYYS